MLQVQLNCTNNLYRGEEGWDSLRIKLRIGVFFANLSVIFPQGFRLE